MGIPYSFRFTGAVGTNKALGTVISAASVRPEVYDIMCGCPATPAEAAADMVVQRFTTTGTAGSNPTPRPTDPRYGASTTTAGSGDFSPQPGFTASEILLSLAFNQRAFVRWCCQRGDGLICPATASNGLGLQSVTATGTASYSGQIFFQE